ncbi:hypothetical protein HIM_09723 [Hirsutella minnesotensis 3608]|uniref:Cytochrome P450 n=1 Tax=Hirsutella minnesotensis 3608 TaxID=1043627 RepID=A0A0F7ZXK8_9HYPO|nr:hypothetical protein HIM_09723 [Hirsutella minnesotensis 3608]
MALAHLAAPVSPLMAALMTCAALWLAWYIWSFKVWPRLHPELPRRFPYWIPVIGHIRGMVANSSKVFTNGRLYFRNTREIFSLIIMGQELYVVTDPAHVQAVYKQPIALDHEAMAVDILLELGMTKETVDRIFMTLDSNKSFMQATHGNFRIQMHPGSHLEEAQALFLSHIDKSLRWESISGSELREVDGNTKVVSLWEWCGNVLVDSAIEAFFDRSLYDCNSEILKDFFVFDDESWKLPYQLPKFVAKDLHSSMEKCIRAVSAWLDTPAEKRKSSWIIRRMEQDMDQIGIKDSYQRGAMIFIVFRLINTNAYRLCFWCLAYLLFDPELTSEIQEEMRPAWNTHTAEGGLDMEYLEKCPLLSSFYEEVLRTTVDTIGARVVAQKTTIGNKILLPGRKLLMPYRQAHFDPDVFGQDAASFNPRRFLQNKKLNQSPSWKPFGGGLAWCPGRFLARREVYTFLGIVLFRFDLSLFSPDGHRTPVFPTLDETYPYGGVLTPKKGEVLLVEVRSLANKSRD